MCLWRGGGEKLDHIAIAYTRDYPRSTYCIWILWRCCSATTNQSVPPICPPRTSAPMLESLPLHSAPYQQPLRPNCSHPPTLASKLHSSPSQRHGALVQASKQAHLPDPKASFGVPDQPGRSPRPHLIFSTKRRKKHHPLSSSVEPTRDSA